MNLIEGTNVLISENNEISSLKIEEGYKEIYYDTQTLLENQKINQKEMRIGFIWLAT